MKAAKRFWTELTWFGF